MEDREETLSVTTTMVPAADFYLPDECWECVFRFLKDGDDHNNISLKYLSVVSKQFLSITNCLLFTITFYAPTRHRLSRLFQRFPNLTSLNLSRLNVCNFCTKGFCWVSSLASSLMLDFVVRPQLKSLYLDHHSCLRDQSIISFSSIFPNLQFLDLSFCREVHICQVLRRFSNIRHLNLTKCLGLKLRVMNFKVPNLEVLYLSHTRVDDEALYVISKSCCGLLQLYLNNCYCVTTEGVKHVVENCTQIREINLEWCHKVNVDVLALLIFSRPSLRKLTTYHYRFWNREIFELLARQGCIVC